MAAPIPVVTLAAEAEYAYTLLELPPELDRAFSQEGTQLVFNGRLSDEATLLTADATYAVRQVSQSNSLLLCALSGTDDAPCLEMRKNVHDLLELVRTTPRVDRLAELLGADAYRGDAHESATQRHYTPSEVRSIVQASEGELQQGLRAHHIVLLRGYWRRVAPELVESLLASLLAHLDIFACTPDAVPYARMCDALAPRACRPVAEALVGSWFCASPPSATPPTHVALARAEIARFMGLQLLNTHKDALGALRDEAQLPLLRVRTRTAHTQGFYLLYPPPASFANVRAHAPRPADPGAAALASIVHIQAMAHTALPLSPAHRFQELFQMREQWLREELAPFVEPLAAGTATLDSLLLKHGRSVRARWTPTHASVLLHGAFNGVPGASDECTVVMAKVKYS